MPYNRTPESKPALGHGLRLATPRTMALILLIALLVLWGLRHFFGSITISAGTR